MKGFSEMMVWVDLKSQLPDKIVIRDSDPQHPMEIRFEKITWNEPLDAQLFSLKTPAGYKSGTVMTEPRSAQPAPPPTSPSETSKMLEQGILSHDRAPFRILWDREGKSITAMLRDPETTPIQNRRRYELRQWEVATGKLLWSETVAGASCVAASPNGKTLATVIGYEVQLRDATTGKVTRTWETDKDLSPLVFSPDGRILAAGITEWGQGGRQESGGVQFWDVERAVLLRTIPDDKVTTTLKYSIDGQQVVTASNVGPVKLWDASTGELQRVFPGSNAEFSPDGETLACPSMSPTEDKTVTKIDLFNLKSGALVKSLTGEKAATTSYPLWFSYSPDGRQLAVASWNETVTIWDVGTGERRQTITGHKGGVLVVSFAPDGKTLATGSEDKTLQLWKP